MYEILESSPKAKALITDYTETREVATELNSRTSKYPCDMLRIGQSFAVPYEEMTEVSVRNAASLCAKRTLKKFTVIKHNDVRKLEVARIG